MNSDLLESISENVYKSLGRFHPKTVYSNALATELSKKGISYSRDKLFPILYNDTEIGTCTFDFVLEDTKCVIDVLENTLVDVDYMELFKNRLRNIGIPEGYIIFFLRNLDESDRYISVIRMKV